MKMELWLETLSVDLLTIIEEEQANGIISLAVRGIQQKVLIKIEEVRHERERSKNVSVSNT